ncbi:MAG: lytic murein transglycosylase [Sulfurimonas sp.]|uniref:lytic murein transglycosylase n=1 Tax=Sulfurimonas sp. TaxID=2022749 RepID=UPI0025D0A02E|nr:lytic murein transglycosylase [Sulfurimonas sp.]MCK9492388.1 lytic murein transglycosylase [Sulfurimonas sp.]
MIKIILLLALSTSIWAKYTNCEFKNKHYEDICEQLVKEGVSYDYANKFLLSYFKTKKYDEVSWKYLQPKHIITHKKSEKKANNVLVKYVPDIVQHLKKYKEVYDYSEKKYGVNREIVAAILMKESGLGKIKPTHDAFIVFNTIVTRVDPKSKRDKWLLKMGKDNMKSVIKYCYKKGVKPESCNLASSYAGAVGIPQFMPFSFVYMDSYRSKVADLSKMEDAITSASNYLNIKAEFSTLIEWSKMPDIDKLESDWYDFEHERNHENVSLVYKESRHNKNLECFTCDKSELDYFREFAKKIMRYNSSSNYTIGVMRLAYDAHILLHKEESKR